VSCAKGAYTEAYGPELEITDVTHEREVAFIKHPARGDGAVIVIDTLTSEN
jgi:hypothetical protein